MGRLRWQDLVAGSVVVASILVAFSDVLGPGEGLFFRDHGIAWRPRYLAIREAFLRGELPILTDAARGDLPMEVLPTGAYSPLILLLFLGDFDLGFDFMVIGTYLWMGLGHFILLREVGADSPAALAGALVATLSGPILSMENLYPYAYGLAWFPWIMLAFRRVLVSEGPARWTWVGALGLASGFQLQMMVPGVAWLDLLGGSFLLVWERRRLVGRAGLHRLAASSAAFVLALGVASIGLFPVLAFLRTTRRSAGLSYFERAQWSWDWAELVDLFVPSVWWDPPNGVYQLELHLPHNAPYLLSAYLGLGLAIALGSSLRGIRERRMWSFFALAGLVLAVLAALGPKTPVHWLASELPLLRMARYPTKFLVFASVIAGGLVAWGLHAHRRCGPWFLGVVALQLFGVLAFSVWTSTSSFESWLAEQLMYRRNVLPIQGVAPEDLAHLAHAAVSGHAALALTSLGLGALVLVVARKQDFQTPWTPWLLAAVVALDLGTAGTIAVVGADVRHARLPESIRTTIADDEHSGLYLFSLPGGTPAVALRPEEDSFLGAYMRAKDERGSNAYGSGVHRVGDFDSQGFSGPLPPMGIQAFKQLPAPRSYRVAARLGIGWLSTFAPMPGNSLQMKLPAEAPQYFTPLPDAVQIPRVWVSPQWRELPRRARPGQLLAAVEAGPDPGLPVVLTETATVARIRGDASCPPPEVAPAWTRDLRVDVKISSPCPSFVRLQQNRVHGWQASVDGEEAPLRTVDFGVMGVEVPAGEHAVRIAYAARSPGLLPLWFASLLVAFALVVVGAVMARRRSAREAPSQAAV